MRGPEIDADVIIGFFVFWGIGLGILFATWAMVWYLTRHRSFVPGRVIGTVHADLDLPEGH